ncbi:polymer-forming cytoskeletal protein [Halovenus sp. HT40]|uniref:polymer-forming cytoskeletal protein n=1 Tax=Halovenus sp. HT40 TaxID=3126691 RepID=UPI00300F5924
MTQQPTRGERGQLVLIAAILVATTIVGAVVLLNAVHSSPDVKAQTDAQSLADAEKVTNQIQTNLRELFFATTSSEKRAYANETDIYGTIGSYEERFSRFVSQDTASVVSVQYEDGKSGAYVEDDSLPTSGGPVIEDAAELPYLTVRAESSAQSVEIEITSGSETTVAELDGDGSEIDSGGEVTDCTVGDGTVQFSMERGIGRISGEDGVCTVQIYEQGEPNSIDVAIDASGADGNFAVSAVDPTSVRDDSSFFVRKDVIVNPTFSIEYINPDVSLSTVSPMFGRGELIGNGCDWVEDEMSGSDLDMTGQTAKCDFTDQIDESIKKIGNNDIDLSGNSRLVGEIDTDGDVNIDNSTVIGDIRSDSDDITITNNARIDGDIVAAKNTNIDIDGGTVVTGDVVGKGDGSVSLDHVTVKGDVYVESDDFGGCNSNVVINGQDCGDYTLKNPDNY